MTYWRGVNRENFRMLGQILEPGGGRVDSCVTRPCSLPASSTYCAEYSRPCPGPGELQPANTDTDQFCAADCRTCSRNIRNKPKESSDKNLELEVSFEDLETGNIFKEVVQVNPRKINTIKIMYKMFVVLHSFNH